MILLCPKCYRSYVFEDDEVKAKGGPKAFACEECSGTLESMEVAMGVSLGAHDTSARGEDDPSASVGMPPLQRQGSTDTEGKSFERMEPTEAEILAIPEPEQQVFVPPQRGRTGMIPSAPPPSPLASTDATRPVGAPLGLDATRSIPAATGRKTATSTPEPSSQGKGLGFAFGCLALLALLVVGGGGAAALWFYVGDGGGKPDAGDAGDAGKPGPRASIEDRLRLMTQNYSSASIPAVALPEPPQEGELVLLTPAGIVIGEDMVASVNHGHIDAQARPNEKSPFVIPLASALDKGFADHPSENLGEDNRWTIVLIDGKVSVETLHAVLYTAWTRGARVQLAATNPNNPQTFAAVEVLPQDQPSAVAASIPDEVSPLDPARTPDPNAKAVVVGIREDGFSLRAPEVPPDQAHFIERGTGWTSQLRSELAQTLQKNPGITALVIEAEPKVNVSSLLNATSALLQPSGGGLPFKELRFTPPITRPRPTPPPVEPPPEPPKEEKPGKKKPK